MEDITQELDALGKRYWIRWYDAEVTDVQSYNVGSTNVRVTNNFNHYHNFGSDQTVSVQSNNFAQNRVFVRNASESNFFDVNTLSFAAAPGHRLRLTYIGPVKGTDRKYGYLSYARNVTNGSVTGFDYWHAFVPKARISRFLFVAALVLLTIDIAASILAGRGSSFFLTGSIAAGALVFMLVQTSVRSAAIKKIASVASQRA